MRKLNIFEKIVVWFKYLLINKEKAKEKSDKAKREMCSRAVQSGVCPHTCAICAWNTNGSEHKRTIDADELLKRISEKAKIPSLSEDTVNGLCGATAIIYDMLIESEE